MRACTETAGRTLRTRIAFKAAPNGALPTNTTRRRNAVRFASNQSDNQAYSKAEKAGPEDIGLTAKEIHEARVIRYAEAAPKK